MFQRLGGNPDNLVHLERVEDEIRARFGLVDDDLVLVSEAASGLPGFPDLDTTIRFWSDGQRYRVRVFKPVRDVAAADLPVAWLKPSLVDDGDADCC